MKRQYHLSGMKWIATGSLVQMAAYLALKIAQLAGQSVLSDAADAAGLAGSILVIVGLFQTARYSDYLRNATISMLAAVLFSTAAALLAGPGYGGSAHPIISAGILAAEVLLLAAAIAAVLAIFSFFQGCQEIAEDQRQSNLSKLCWKALGVYLILFIAGIILAGASDLVAIKSEVPAILVISDAAFTIAAKAVICYMAWKTFQEFHGKMEIEDNV